MCNGSAKESEKSTDFEQVTTEATDVRYSKTCKQNWHLYVMAHYIMKV